MKFIKTVYGKVDNEMFDVEEGLMASVIDEFFYNGESWYKLYTDNFEVVKSPSIFWEDERDTSKDGEETILVELAYEKEKEYLSQITFEM